MRNLIVVLGDQLSLSSVAFEGFDAGEDLVWMAEVREESEHVPSTKMRTALFLSAMRHFAEEVAANGMRLEYLRIGEHRFDSIGAALGDALSRHRPDAVLMAEPGDWRVERAIERTCGDAGVRLVSRDDLHFLASRAEFTRHAQGKQRLVMENFYRQMRVKHHVLIGRDGRPEGGRWNFDHENRNAFGRKGPGMLPPAPSFEPDALTREVLGDVETHFGDHYGDASAFDWPVTRGQALAALRDFADNRLQDFGRFQDAMWAGEPVLYHSMLSPSLNLKLLDPREVIDAAVAKWRSGGAPLEAVEGFVRQIMGWREFMRGVYWWRMPELAAANALGHDEDLPGWYWTGEVGMNCMRQALGQTLRTGHAHHIQRLMVTGNFALTFGAAPSQVHAWYLSVYVDAVEWVELPNTAGMSLYADGGRFVTKPYAAGGAYIHRMSNYCEGCRYKPAARTGESACPMTVMYWDFVARHEPLLAANPRTVMMTRNLQRLGSDEVTGIRRTAASMRDRPERL